MTTLVPIEHVERGRRGLVLRRGHALAEASPLASRSGEAYDELLRAITLGGGVPPSLDFALWSLETERVRGTVASQVLLERPATAVDEARAASARGRRAFKLKIRSADDATVALAVRAAVPDALLRVDANRAFASPSGVPWDELARAGVAWVEEPCPDAGALAGTPIPVALDESVEADADAALDAVASGRVAALVLKPTILGASETLRVARACLSAGGRAILSHAFESEIGRRAAEQLALRVAPGETHGLAPWTGIEAYRICAGGTPVRTLLDAVEDARVALAMG